MSEDNYELTLAQGVKLTLSRIPAGEFWMGSDIWSYLEAPRHRQVLPEYWIGKTPVTVSEYASFVKSSAYPTRPGQIEDEVRLANLPVVCVSWQDARAFCRWVNAVILAKNGSFSGLQARLPGEAEWEKASRGTDGRDYPWGNESPDETRCSYNRKFEDFFPVGHFSPRGDSPYGCVDMAGTVWEWTNSLLKPYPYTVQDGRENVDAPGERVVRGGASYSFSGSVRCTYRASNDPEKFFTSRGMRICISPLIFQ